MNDEHVGRSVDHNVAHLVRNLAQANPGKSVNLTVSHAMHHSGQSVRMMWTMQIGHDDVMHGDSFADIIAKQKHWQTPAFKLSAAARLRREADQLEAAAKLQSEQPNQPPSHG